MNHPYTTDKRENQPEDFREIEALLHRVSAHTVAPKENLRNILAREASTYETSAVENMPAGPSDRGRTAGSVISNTRSAKNNPFGIFATFGTGAWVTFAVLVLALGGTVIRQGTGTSFGSAGAEIAFAAQESAAESVATDDSKADTKLVDSYGDTLTDFGQTYDENEL